MNKLKFIRKAIPHIMILLLPAATSAQGIRITNGSRITMIGPVKLVLHNAGLDNEALFDPGNSGILLFTGSQDVAIAGSSLFALQNVIINKSGGAVVNLKQDVLLNGTLAMKSGNLLLNKQTLHLVSAGSIEGESNHSHITGDTAGRIVTLRTISTPLIAFNPGNIGVELTSAVAPGPVFIERKHVPFTLPGGLQSIRRSFNISAFNNTTPNATLRFYYLDTELGTQNEDDLIVWSIPDIGFNWAPLGKDNNDAGGNWVEKTGVGRWGWFTLAGPGNAFMRSRPAQPQQENNIAAEEVFTYPNPTQDLVTMKLVSRQEKNILLALYDQAGRLLQQKNIRCRIGMNTITWNISDYAAGIYYIASGDIKGRSVKIVKE
jgi:hypothetical protein